MSETLFERRAQAQEHYRRGIELKQSGFLLEAEQKFRQSLEEDPAYFDPLLELLVEQEQTGIAEDIRTDELLRRADQKFKLGLTLLKNRRAEKALRHLKAACDAETDNAKYHCAYGEALLAAGREGEAHETLRYSAELNGGSNPREYRARAHLLLGESHLKAGHLKRAKWRLQAAYSLDPDNEEVLPLLRQLRLGFWKRLFLLRRRGKA